MIRIRITHEQGFASKECLEEALEMHNLLSGITIIKEGDKYQLHAILSEREGDKLKMEESLKNELEKVVEIILPTYTRLLATEDFGIKGFKLKEEKRNTQEEVLIFERNIRLDGQYIPEQIVLRIKGIYGLNVETKNFRGKNCLHATKSFEEDIGQVIHREMKPEAATNNRRLQERRLLEIPICR